MREEGERERERESFLIFRVMGYLGIFLSGHAGAFPFCQREGRCSVPSSLSLSVQ